MFSYVVFKKYYFNLSSIIFIMDTKNVNSSALIPRIWEKSVFKMLVFRYKIPLGISLKLTHFGLIEHRFLGLTLKYLNKFIFEIKKSDFCQKIAA